MKKYVFYIDRFQAGWAFAPIRDKKDLVEILVRTLKLMLTPVDVPAPDRAGEVILLVQKMSRLFYRSESKMYSIAFPYTCTELEGRLLFYSHSHPSIDSKATSDVLALLRTPGLLTTSDVLTFADPICTACEIDSHIWSLLREMLLAEGGYVRYDDDIERADGHRHPRHHLDLFYSQGSTFKAGLRDTINHDDFADILNIETDCRYLHPAI
jgi:hypothetical protein